MLTLRVVSIEQKKDTQGNMVGVLGLSDTSGSTYYTSVLYFPWSEVDQVRIGDLWTAEGITKHKASSLLEIAHHGLTLMEAAE